MRLAIIDIGYNAIRAVVYKDNEIGAPEIFNTKFKNDVLNLLINDDLNIKHQTYLTIQYLLHVFDNLLVDNIKCVATAVLREHPRAHDFVTLIKEKYNLEIKIISGEEEARLTALGLVIGINHARGIAADLGGGSLELVEISDNQIGKLNSFELGTKVIAKNNLGNQKTLTEIISTEYKDSQYQNLYLIGGALRFIGRLYIDIMNYPIKNLHNLEIPTEDFLLYLNRIRSASEKTKHKLGKRKVNNHAILIAKSMIEVFQPENIVVSTYGLKEGVRIEYLGKDPSDIDIVLEKVKYITNYNEKETDFNEYADILSPLIRIDAEILRLLKLSIMLLQLKNNYDKTLPPNALVERILSSEIPFMHHDRIKLALILSYNSNYKPGLDLIKISKKIMSKKDYNFCQIIGHFLYIAEEIDGPIFKSPSFLIKIENNFLEIVSQEILPRAIFEKICIRLKSIAYCRKVNSN